MQKLDFFSLLRNAQGKTSLNKTLGALMIINGLLGKNALCVYAAKHLAANFDKIDTCFEGMIYGGVILLGGHIIDKWATKNSQNKIDNV